MKVVEIKGIKVGILSPLEFQTRTISIAKGDKDCFPVGVKLFAETEEAAATSVEDFLSGRFTEEK